jgi:hypothetical protein
MSGTLEITNNLFDLFAVDFYRVLHKPIKHTNIKQNFRSTVNKINKSVDQLSIKCSIDLRCLTSFGEF